MSLRSHRHPLNEHRLERADAFDDDPDAGSPEAIEAMAKSYEATARQERPWEFEPSAELVPDAREMDSEAARLDDLRPRVRREVA